MEAEFPGMLRTLAHYSADDSDRQYLVTSVLSAGMIGFRGCSSFGEVDTMAVMILVRLLLMKAV